MKTNVAEIKPVDLTNEFLSQVLSEKPIIVAWLKEIEREAIRRLKSGDHIDKLTLVTRKASRREWIADREEIKLVLNKYGLDESLMLCLPTFKTFKALLRQAGVEHIYDDVLSELTEQRCTATTALAVKDNQCH